MDVHPKYPPWLPACLRTGWGLSRKINKVYSQQLDQAVINNLLAVEGHTTPRQCAVLFYFACSLPAPGRIVEIGSFKGKSTVWMAQALKLQKSTDKIVAIDPHLNTGDRNIVPQYFEESSYETFLGNVSKTGLTQWVQPVKETSRQASEIWNGPIKLIFIDGAHRYEDVLTDLTLWEPFVRKNGIIVLHDTKPGNNFPGIRRAMNEYLKSSPRFKEILQLLNMTIFEKLL
ncbi:MAG: class I SAM-dependent methyltransferase [Planctomycetota bacterium]